METSGFIKITTSIFLKPNFQCLNGWKFGITRAAVTRF